MPVLAEERSVFVGDIINLQISSDDYSEGEIREAFEGFEIIEIKTNEDGYLVSLRSFEIGEHTVQLGNNEIHIQIQSTLDEIEQDGVFEGELIPKTAGYSINWMIVFGVIFVVFLLSAGFQLVRVIKKRKITALTPFQSFEKAIQTINLNETNALVSLTFALKEYIGKKYSCCIIGKTSSEIMEDINPIMQLSDKLPSIQAWLEQCDYYKYTGNQADIDQNQTMCNQLVEIVKNIEATEEGVS